MNNVNNTFFSMGSAPHAAKRAAGLVFVLQDKDKLGYQKVVEKVNETLKTYGESNPDVTYADLDDLKAAARELHAVFEAKGTVSAATTLNGILGKHAHAPRLSMHGDTPWHLHVDNNDHASWAEWFIASSALALAVLLAEKQRNPAGLCAAPGCGRPFIDLGKGGGRNYCSPKCSTRTRVAAYRHRN